MRYSLDVPTGSDPYSRDHAPQAALPVPPVREERTFARGTGHRARRLWKWATLCVLPILVGVVAAFGSQSEYLGVQAALVASAVLGACAGGWLGVVRAQRAGRKVGPALPWVTAFVGAAAFFVLACAFFFGILPAL